MANQLAKDLFREYRAETEEALAFFNRLKTVSPFGNFPVLAAKGWRVGMLAVIWGTIATELSGRRVRYLENWRTGK